MGQENINKAIPKQERIVFSRPISTKTQGEWGEWAHVI